jgi:single-strand DNA-binding protein
MLNQIILVGRLTKDVEKTKIGDKNFAKINLAVNRNYKNSEGIYETDFIEVELWNAIADSTAEYCRKGDLIGIKGRLETETYEAEDGTTKRKTVIRAEKVTFLSSQPKPERRIENGVDTEDEI